MSHTASLYSNRNFVVIPDSAPGRIHFGSFLTIEKFIASRLRAAMSQENLNHDLIEISVQKNSRLF